jgi:hypothetical protein
MIDQLPRWGGQYKKTARQIALDFKSDPKYAGVYFPGEDCKCVKNSLEMGTINREKMLYLVEHDSKVCKIVNQYALDNLMQYHVHNGEAHYLKINHKIDFAYLDFIGSINEYIYDWIATEIVPNLAPISRISFCFNYAWRPEVPFLEWKYQNYLKQDKIFDISSKFETENSHQIATYLLLLKGLFPNHEFVFNEYKPYFKYNDNINPMVLYTLESKKSVQIDLIPNPERIVTMPVPSINSVKITSKTTKKKIPSQDLDTLISEYPAALKNPDKMRGWKRSKTLYNRNKAKQQGGNPEHFNRAIKMRLTKLGYDTSPLA